MLWRLVIQMSNKRSIPMTLMERYICQKYRRSVEPPVQFRPNGNRGKNKLAVIITNKRAPFSHRSRWEKGWRADRLLDGCRLKAASLWIISRETTPCSTGTSRQICRERGEASAWQKATWKCVDLSGSGWVFSKLFLGLRGEGRFFCSPWGKGYFPRRDVSVNRWSVGKLGAAVVSVAIPPQGVLL